MHCRDMVPAFSLAAEWAQGAPLGAVGAGGQGCHSYGGSSGGVQEPGTGWSSWVVSGGDTRRPRLGWVRGSRLGKRLWGLRRR